MLQLHRSLDVRHLAKHMLPHKEDTLGFEEDEWLSNLDNIALTDGLSNYFLFEQRKPGLYIGHYFLRAKGKRAVTLSSLALSYMFSVAPTRTIIGLTPFENKAARWFSRHMGFKATGQEETTAGTCEVFVLTKAEWLQRNN